MTSVFCGLDSGSACVWWCCVKRGRERKREGERDKRGRLFACLVVVSSDMYVYIYVPLSFRGYYR